MLGIGRAWNICLKTPNFYDTPSAGAGGEGRRILTALRARHYCFFGIRVSDGETVSKFWLIPSRKQVDDIEYGLWWGSWLSWLGPAILVKQHNNFPFEADKFVISDNPTPFLHDFPNFLLVITVFKSNLLTVKTHDTLYSPPST